MDEVAEVLQYRQSLWQHRRITVATLCRERDSLTGNVMVFLPNTLLGDMSTSDVAERLYAAFDISPATWEEQYRKSAGFFLSEPQYSPDGKVLTSHASACRFLIKTPASDSITSRELAPKVSYSWTEVGLWTQWRQDHSSILICCISDPCDTGLQQSLLLRVYDHPPISMKDPHVWFLLVLPVITHTYHQAVWKCRDIVRARETTRPNVREPYTDYTVLHEISRHVLHSTETLTMSIEVVNSVLEDIRVLGEGDTTAPSRILKCQKTLLQCELGRSQALESRLRNEIDLAFHISTQHDSMIASHLSKLARVDSASMKTISILGLVFLPGTFVSSVFGMNFFSFSQDEQGSFSWTTAPNLWWYWAVTIPVTLVTIFLWICWQRISAKKAQS